MQTSIRIIDLLKEFCDELDDYHCGQVGDIGITLLNKNAKNPVKFSLATSPMFNLNSGEIKLLIYANYNLYSDITILIYDHLCFKSLKNRLDYLSNLEFNDLIAELNNGNR